MFNSFARPFLYPSERRISSIPRIIPACLVLALLMQSMLHVFTSRQAAAFRQIPPAISQVEAGLVSLSDPIALARILMLWIQSYDAQPGISVSFKQLDYDRVIEWLNLVLALDPESRSPLLAASRVYAEVNNSEQQRKMLEFVRSRFLEKPNNRWLSMAHAVYVARHKLKDMELALDYATEMTANITSEDVPQWIRQMQIYVLEDMGDLEGAMVLIGGLLESGQIKDEQEIRFLHERLKRLQEESGGNN